MAPGKKKRRKKLRVGFGGTEEIVERLHEK